MSQFLEVLHRLHALAAHPLALVVVAALLAALLEQRLARRRTPDFSLAYRDITARPPPPKPPETP
ncbi:hypothetical protein [Phenylobacterium sp.]|uniref:hypothetical protein n=1 Tax=Phenylobacterium sp. TaxID=1871053 RepID=UPI0012204400|nr:hypothetical protein [Phenylobacterium sp.]THD63645.1 MAG: hypothetical protein E8A49_04610 [Phenylobacterium sp.]